MVPIEQIKVGDWVLSKHESGDGERAYKRVIKAYAHNNRQLIAIGFGGRKADGTDRWEFLAVTSEHPLWVQAKGWKNAADVQPTWRKPTMLELVEPENGNISSNLRLFATDDPNIAWLPGASLPLTCRDTAR